MGKSLAGKELGKNISQRKDGLYQARYIDEYGKRKSIYGKNLRELKQKLKESEEEVKKISILNDGKRLKTSKNKEMTFNDVYEEFLTYRLPEKKFKEKTNYHYIMYKKEIASTFGKKRINTFTKTECEKILINAKKVHGSGVLHLKKTMSKVFEYAIDAGYILNNPFTRINIAVELKSKQAINSEDEKIILSELKNQIYRNMVRLVLYTGLRYGEVAGLTIDNINLDKKIIIIDKQIRNRTTKNKEESFYFSTPKTKSSNRIIPLNEKAVSVISNQLELRKHQEAKNEFSQLLFLNFNGKPIPCNTINTALCKVLKDNKESLSVSKLSMHTFRHTFATRCAEAEISPFAIQLLMGHSSFKTTNKYVHYQLENISDDLNRI